MPSVRLSIDIDEKLIDLWLAAADKHHPWCSTERRLIGAFKKSVRMLVHDTRMARREQRLSKPGIIDGIQRCAKEDPKLFGVFMRGECTEREADIIVQYAVLGKVVFG